MTPIIDDGRLIDPEFHDGLLLGIVLSEDREDLTLFCRREDGKDFSLVVPQIDRLRVDNFLQGIKFLRSQFAKGIVAHHSL
jgi:hypothetical protein